MTSVNAMLTPDAPPREPARGCAAPDGSLLEGPALLDVSCRLAGAQRAGIFRISHEGARFEVGHRMSSQLGLALLPQLDLKQIIPHPQNVVLGTEDYQCLVLHITGPTLSRRTLVTLFEPGQPIYAQVMGRLEGIFHVWWQLPARLSSHRQILHVCSACQHIMAPDGSWISWERFLHQKLGLDASHGLCGTCSAELYGDTSHWSL